MNALSKRQASDNQIGKAPCGYSRKGESPRELFAVFYAFLCSVPVQPDDHKSDGKRQYGAGNPEERSRRTAVRAVCVGIAIVRRWGHIAARVFRWLCIRRGRLIRIGWLGKTTVRRTQHLRRIETVWHLSIEAASVSRHVPATSVHGAHVRQRNGGCVRVIHLFGGFAVCQLRRNALGTKRAELTQGLYTRFNSS